ncbi:T9SS type A sorting domain-containing protein [Aquimarina sp. Aq107]|uniref:T9SS type A sorting domain-containing protein n=1 Tax=Aquimarina sp. Aq107 TaxID=1191912 RepID=UPI000D54AFD5|nr:T9SS type A sorting domain-containing protein [Aquimarina sp. Aq107]
MQTKHFIYALFFLTIQVTFSQVESNYYPEGNALEKITELNINQKTQRLITMPDFNVNTLIEEDKRTEKSEKARPYRFGKSFDTNIRVDVGKDGTDTEDGRVWSSEFYSKGALSINFVLKNLKLADGAELYLYNDSGTMIYGPVTSESNKKKGVFLTDLIFGDRVIMYVKEPKNSENRSSFTIKRVVHAYRGLNSERTWGTPGASEACNNDLACFNAWVQTGNSVALVLLSSGAEHCSGCLLNSTDNSLRPYFLSAFHCADSNNNGTLSTSERNNAEDWLFKFGFRRVSCSTTSSHFNFVNSNGATFRAGWFNTDFLLLEIESLKYNGTHTYAGWDRRTNTPTSGASIHHPAGDLRKISIENNNFQVSSWNGTNNRWLVNFDDGVVQHGSSGSPIFNQNQRVVGQLHGNQNYNPFNTYCNQNRGEYGRFNLSWNGGGTNSTRLSNWLDPCGTGAQTTNTLNGAYTSNPGTIGCTERKVTVYNLPAGSTINWSSSSNLTRTSTQGTNPSTFKANGTGSAWVRAVVTPPNSCGNTYTMQRTATANGASTNMSLSIYGNNNGWVNAQAFGGSAPYNWIIYGINGSTQVTTSSSYLNYYVGCGGGYLQVQATNSCGDSAYGSQSIPGCSGIGIYSMRAYPNPTSDQLTIERMSTTKNFSFDNNIVVESTIITLHDFTGATVKQIKMDYKTNKIQLDVSNLKGGNYFLKITGNGKDETHQIIIE